MMVNLTVEKQLETIIWPTVSVLYLGLLVSFIVIVWKRVVVLRHRTARLGTEAQPMSATSTTRWRCWCS